MSFLILYPGKPHQTAIELTSSILRIGRDPTCHLCLHEDGVSTQHAQLEKCGQGYALRDLESTNGTEVNGRPISFHVLNHNDLITMGDVAIRFSITGELNPELEAVPAEDVSPELLAPTHYPAPVAMPGGLIASDPNFVPAPYSSQLPGSPIHPLPSPVPPGSMMLPLLAFLASLTIIGFPLALVLGVMGYVHLRRHGGAAHEWRLTRWALGISFLSFMAITVATTAYVLRKNALLREVEAKEEIIKNEASAIGQLKGIAAAQAYARTIELVDKDGDGEGEYLTLEELSQTGSTFIPSQLSTGKSNGYQFTIRDVGESSYSAYAEPLRYNKTGLRTFHIDQSGQIRGGDLEGKAYLEDPRALPILPTEKNALQGLADEIAKDIVHYLKTLSLDEGSIDKVLRISNRLKTEFALTDSGQALSGISRTVDQFVLDQRGMELWSTANKQVEAGQTNTALNTLHQLLETLPEYTRRPEVEERLKTLKQDFSLGEERAAKSLQEQADALERQGNQAAALEMYSTIETRYPDTETAQRIRSVKPELDRQRREQDAEDLFFTLVELNPVEDYIQVLSLADQLSRNFNDTAVYTNNQSAIDAHVKKAHTQKWRHITLEEMDAGRTRAALARLEAATENQPDLRLGLRDVFIELYDKIGARLMEEQDYREALRIYAALSELVQGTEQVDKVPLDKLAELHYNVGFAEADQKNYEQARFHLSQASIKYQDDPFFQLKLGTVSLHSGRYTSASKAFSQAIQLNEGMEQANLYRSYLNLRYVVYSEKALVSTFNGKPTQAASSTNASSGVLEFNDMLKQLQNSLEHTVAEPVYTDLDQSPVPDPNDIEITLEYNHAASSLLLPTTIALIRKFSDASGRFNKSINEARVNENRNSDDARMDSYMEVSQFQTQLSAVRKAINQDAHNSDQFLRLLVTMQRQLSLVIQDLKAASTINPERRELAARVASEVDRKRQALQDAQNLLSEDIKRRAALQEKAINYADQVLRELRQGVNSGLNVVTLVRELNRSATDEGSLEKGLQALEKAVLVDMHLEDIYYSASGKIRTRVPTSAEPAEL